MSEICKRLVTESQIHISCRNSSASYPGISKSDPHKSQSYNLVSSQGSWMSLIQQISKRKNNNEYMYNFWKRLSKNALKDSCCNPGESYRMKAPQPALIIILNEIGPSKPSRYRVYKSYSTSIDLYGSSNRSQELFSRTTIL